MLSKLCKRTDAECFEINCEEIANLCKKKKELKMLRCKLGLNSGPSSSQPAT
jgi:hypothetical protein